MPLDDTTLDHLAELARLELVGDARNALRHDLARVLDYLAQLQGVDVSGVAPMTRPFEEAGAAATQALPSGCRADALDTERALTAAEVERLAPGWLEGRVRVARTVDDGS